MILLNKDNSIFQNLLQKEHFVDDFFTFGYLVLLEHSIHVFSEAHVALPAETVVAVLGFYSFTSRSILQVCSLVFSS